jgi:hypothetical protein
MSTTTQTETQQTETQQTEATTKSLIKIKQEQIICYALVLDLKRSPQIS